MKKKFNLGKKLSLSKEKLSQLNETQLAHFMGGRMAASTGYTAGDGSTCSNVITGPGCCGWNQAQQ